MKNWNVNCQILLLEEMFSFNNNFDTKLHNMFLSTRIIFDSQKKLFNQTQCPKNFQSDVPENE